jgi:hypothetical protein
MNFYDRKRECKACRSEPFDKDMNGNEICIAQHTMLCSAVSCPSSHYWTIGKQKQIGWTHSRALEMTGLERAFEEEILEEG